MTSPQNSKHSNGAPVSIDYQKLFSKQALRLRKSTLWKNAAYMVADGYIKMGTGFTNPEVFPVVEANFKLLDGSVINVGKDMVQKHLQYGLSSGYPDLRSWVTDFQRRLHSPPIQPDLFDVILTSGSTDAITLVMKVFMDEGDWLLVEEATFTSPLTATFPMGLQALGIPVDSHGIVPEELEKVLTSWNDLHPGARKPKLLYVIPSCGNPTGITTSLDRKRAIYDVARKHDLMILEDDPYYFLNFTRPMIPTLLSMDVDGRVIRLDSFSKVVAPGLRAGLVSGPRAVLEKAVMFMDYTSLGAAGLSQMLILALLRHWGHDGFLRHLDSVMEFYKHRVEMVLSCAKKHLTGLAEWDPPGGGLFVWMKVLGVSDSEIVIDRLLKEHVVMVGGACFTPSNEKNAHMRISVAMVTEEECDKAFSSLAKVIRSLQAEKK
ncbi:kynurenine/alpha-aminoadipate aminotransferase, mitochondrial-like [Babylonia areolata]|uniref:kynurenine/alpha-aminoadipate aminotransferase, mitochondrial-like n=1 Tax=Babylonia areolata TaxID=304850 RepID=UPI003FCFE0EF